MISKKVRTVAIAVIGLTITVYLYLQAPDSDAQGTSTSVGAKLTAQVPWLKSPFNFNSVAKSKEPQRSQQNTIESNAVAEPKELAQWLSQESEELDKLSNENEDDIAATLQRRAQVLSANERRWLSGVTLNSERPINERALATYLLSLTGSPSMNLLSEIAKAPLSGPAEFTPHSSEEREHMQDKTVRIMALEQMAQQVRDNPSLLSEFKQTVEAISDPAVRAYGVKLLRELERFMAH